MYSVEEALRGARRGEQRPQAAASRARMALAVQRAWADCAVKPRLTCGCGNLLAEDEPGRQAPRAQQEGRAGRRGKGSVKRLVEA